MAATKTYQKAEQTRAKILEESLKLFLKKGFEAATMRQIAKAAGLAPGAAYYYFPTKDHIVFAFYQRAHEEQGPGVQRVLAEKTGLRDRIAGTVKAHLEIARPYHAISKALFKAAADPSNPISPFSPESKPLRDKETEIFRQVLEGSGVALRPLYKKELPGLLWLYKMGIILYWLYDQSPGQAKTFRLVDQSAALIARFIGLSNLPLIRGVADHILGLYVAYRPRGAKS